MKKGSILIFEDFVFSLGIHSPQNFIFLSPTVKMWTLNFIITFSEFLLVYVSFATETIGNPVVYQIGGVLSDNKSELHFRNIVQVGFGVERFMYIITPILCL